MVQDFRRMWAESGVEEEARLVQSTEGAAKVGLNADSRYSLMCG